METDATDQTISSPPDEALTDRTHSDASLLAYIKGDSANPVEDETIADAEQAAETLPTSDETAAAEVAEDTDVDGDPVVETAEAAVEESAPWYGADDLEFAKQYGLSQYDLATFSGRDELLKTTRYLDRYSATHKTAAPAEPPKAAEEPVADGPFNKDGTVNVEWFKKGEYDEGQLAIVEALQKQQQEAAALKQQNEWLAKNYAAQQEAQINEVFHDSVDALARPELYGQSLVDGRPQRVPDAAARRRHELRQEVDILAGLYEQKGIAPPTFAELVRRAENNLYANEIAALSAKKAEADSRQKTEAIVKQSTRRRPVAASAGATSKVVVPDLDPNSPEAILARPDFQEWKARKREEYGE